MFQQAERCGSCNVAVYRASITSFVWFGCERLFFAHSVSVYLRFRVRTVHVLLVLHLFTSSTITAAQGVCLHRRYPQLRQ
jgi:hypothetical protein